jgi:hypothetical protein
MHSTFDQPCHSPGSGWGLHGTRRDAIRLAVLAGLRVAALPCTAPWLRAGGSEQPVVAVATLNDIEAFSQALQGLRELLPSALVIDVRQEPLLTERLRHNPCTLAIAFGSTAASVLERIAPPQLPLISSVVLESDCRPNCGGANPSRFRSSVTIDLPAETLTAEIARLFPTRKRLGLLQGPLQAEAYLKTFDQAARRKGLSLVVEACSHPRDLVDAFLRLQSRADLVWCPPNPQLYNSATLKPLLMASLTNRLPIIGFSRQLVQAGALFGGAADFVETGRQTASLAYRVVKQQPVPEQEKARKFCFAYNQRVSRLLGVKAELPDPPGELEIIR